MGWRTPRRNTPLALASAGYLSFDFAIGITIWREQLLLEKLMQLLTLAHFMLLDGGLFTLVGLIVLVNPSPQPTLKTPVNDVALAPFEDTRRLLASQFITAGVLIFTLGWFVHDTDLLRFIAWLRVITLLLVAAVNLSQLRRGFWKPQSLYALIGVWSVFCVLYILLSIYG